MSNKVEIRCVCDGIRIPDLDLVLSKGQVIQLSEAVALGSTDLLHAARVGGVRFRTLRGPNTLREAQNPARPRRDSSRMRLRETKVQNQEASESDKLRSALAETLAGYQDQLNTLAKTLQGTLAKVSETPTSVAVPQSVDPKALESMIQGALEKVALSLPAATSQGPAGSDTLASVGDSGPMFIPEGIVVDTSADIGTSEGSSGFSVDEATEALKAMKKAKAKKKTKK